MQKWMHHLAGGSCLLKRRYLQAGRLVNRQCYAPH